MAQANVELYGYVTSPFVVKVGIFLKYKRIPFKMILANPVRPSPQLKQFPGQRKVPELKIGDNWGQTPFSPQSVQGLGFVWQ